jgi:hypothetical protein
MKPEEHRAKAERVYKSLTKADVFADYEMVIEGAMLAAGHWVNAALHEMGYFPPSMDLMHMTKLTLEDYLRLRAIAPAMINSFFELEELRSPYVRGAEPNGELGARQALLFLDTIRAATKEVQPHGILLPTWHSGSPQWKKTRGWS